MQHHVERPVDKILSPAGMAAIMEEHANAFSGCGRMAELLDIAAPPKCWNYFGTMLQVDCLKISDGEPAPEWDEAQDFPP